MRGVVVAGAVATIATVLAVLSTADGARLHALLDYRREAIFEGAWWTFVTGHLMHLTARHAAVDIVALLLVGWIFRDDLGDLEAAGVFAAGVVAVDIGLWTLHPDVERYVGLSGALHAWFAAGITVWIASDDADGRKAWGLTRRGWGVLLALALVAKLGIEMRGSSFWTDASLPVVTAAHRWGAVGGVIAASGVLIVRRLRRTARMQLARRHRERA